jgi:hypothetical protein
MHGWQLKTSTLYHQATGLQLATRCAGSVRENHPSSDVSAAAAYKGLADVQQAGLVHGVRQGHVGGALQTKFKVNTSMLFVCPALEYAQIKADKVV